MIAVPDFAAGAMENWGLITYRSVCILFDMEKSSVATKERVGIDAVFLAGYFFLYRVAARYKRTGEKQDGRQFFGVF